MSDLSGYIKELVESRVDQINTEIAKMAWYRELQEKLISLHKNLPQDIKQLIREVNAINNEIAYNTSLHIYRIGFSDGTQFLSAMAPDLAPNRQLQSNSIPIRED